MSPRIFWVVVGCSAAAILAAALWLSFTVPRTEESPRDFITPTSEITIDGIQVRIALADTSPLRALGLSGVQQLKEGEVMLFVFEEEGMHSFWMKDMLFSIDMLWISSNGRVVFIEKSVTPESYPKAFISNTPAQYVLEVGAGFSEKYGIEVGDRAIF